MVFLPLLFPSRFPLGYFLLFFGVLQFFHFHFLFFFFDDLPATEIYTLSLHDALPIYPSQAFDNAGRLFYSYICFNRGKPVNGGVYVARYTDDGGTYDRTVLVKKGAPSALFNASGLFQDKDNIAVDQTNGSHSGNVYVAWSQYTGQAGNNAVLVSRSTDHGLTFSQPIRATPVALGTASFADVAVGPDGAVYVSAIDYPSTSNPSTDVWVAKSTDGGES